MILDGDLAALYGVTTSALNQAVTRNAARFPEDFAFFPDPEELASLKSQTVISKSAAMADAANLRAPSRNTAP